VPIERNLLLGDGQEVLLLSRLLASENPSGDVDIRDALEILNASYGVNVLLVEGGPTLNHALISHGLVDELFLTLAPKLLGGISSEPSTVFGNEPLPPETPTPDLLSVNLAGDELFLRYTFIRS
jgi:riboflavin biosynthesis pyrimidine reductase